jgi:Zn-dependent M28 family amino/carboxypeptidase
MPAIMVLLCLILYAGSAQAQWLIDIKTLSSAAMQGRETGTAGAELARQFIQERYVNLSLAGFAPNYQHKFNYGFRQKKVAINMVGYRQGCTYPEHFIVVTAHYDHLGTQGRKVFYGADDNASGVAAMLELAARLSVVCPAYSYLFVATDAEEDGLYGSKAFVAAPPVPLSRIVLNLNLDMLSHPDRRGKLYLTGARRYPALLAQLEADFSNIRFLHHRGPPGKLRDKRRLDWPNASDHGPFHQAGIAYLFFGGQEHAYYHTTADTWQRIKPAFPQMAMQAIWHTVQWVEQQPPTVLQLIAE